MKKIKIKPEILSLLTSGSFQQFNIKDLIYVYRKLPGGTDLSQTQAQQFISRNIERLIRAGLAERTNENKGLKADFRLTERFCTQNYCVGSPHFKGRIEPETNKASNSDENPFLALVSQLNKHKLELLTTIAETEEYETLCQQIPTKQSEIQELYNEARNRYSKTLGKIKAIEALISRSNIAIT